MIRKIPILFAFSCVVVVITLLSAACNRRPQTSESAAPQSGEWRDFQGTWTAAGNRNSMRLGGKRRASIANFNGSLVLAGPSRPGIGFRSEAIVFSDSNTGLVGRAVWTDERGDEVFSDLLGEGTANNNKIIGMFTGGTGRYAGATGSYQFSWRFLLENEEGAVQGQSVGLRGTVRVNPQQAKSAQGGPQS